MSKFRLTFAEMVYYVVDIEADSAEELTSGVRRVIRDSDFCPINDCLTATNREVCSLEDAEGNPVQIPEFLYV